MSAWYTATAVILLTVVVSASGCERALFADKLPRTQYERYQVLRGRYRSAAKPNTYGERAPVLRERLAPLEQP